MKTYHTDHAVITVPITLTYTHLHKHRRELIFCLICYAQPKENIPPILVACVCNMHDTCKLTHHI